MSKIRPEGKSLADTIHQSFVGIGDLRKQPQRFASGGIVGKKADFIIMDDIMEKESNQVSKFAPVAPYHIYQQMVCNQYVPKQVLLLAHDVVDKEEEYRETFAHPAWNGTTIFMDNSLVELKTAVDIEMVKKAVEIVCADVVVLPDAMGDGPKTVDLIKGAWQEWRWAFNDAELLAVLQGQTPEDLVATCEALIHADITPHWVSIPRISEKGNYDRLKMIPLVQMFFPMSQLHLLGFSDYPWMDFLAASHPSVKSIDSAVPLRVQGKWNISQDPGPRDEKWFENAEFSRDMIANCVRIDRLIGSAGIK